MTLHHHESGDRRSPRAHNRARRKLKDFSKQWGDIFMLVIGVVIACLAAAVIVIALQIRTASIEDAKDAKQAKENATASCERSRSFGPALAVAYSKYQILSPEQVAAYRATIPDHC
jgi:hypothetical protein